VGASTDRSKFGNRVLRCYVQHGYSATPVNKKESSIEGIACTATLTEWVQAVTATATATATSSSGTSHAVITADKLGVSIVTPPAVTNAVLEEGYSLGVRQFFLQVGRLTAPRVLSNDTKRSLVINHTTV
jgi:uncharacterized protein